MKSAKLTKANKTVFAILMIMLVSSIARGAHDVPETLEFPRPFPYFFFCRGPVAIATHSITITGNSACLLPPRRERIFVAPKVTLKPGFKIEKGDRFKAGPLVFYLHFVAMAADADFPNHDGITTPSTCTNCRTGFHPFVAEDIPLLLESINRHFVTETGMRFVRFKFGGFTAYDELTASDKLETLYSSITSSGPYSGSTNDTNFNSCTSPRLCNHNAINVYLFDNNYQGEGNTSHGRSNSNKPYILVDIDRIIGIDATTGLPEVTRRRFEHELGHGFGLGHTCEASSISTTNADSNVMGAIAYCSALTGTVDNDGNDCTSLAVRDGGNREIGFSYESLDDCPTSAQANYKTLGQVDVIYSNGLRIARELTPEYFE